jgi:hypothetical protein
VLHETDDTFNFAVASNRDLFAIKKSNTGTNSTEVHILSAASNYQQWVLKTGTVLHETDDTFDFAVAFNRDLFVIKKSNTGTNSTEVHILSAASNYQRWVLQTGTALHETDDTFAFAIAPNRDLVAIKKSNTGTNSTEVHILSAASNYKQWVLQTGTALHETDDTFSFALVYWNPDFYQDLMAIKKSKTETHTTEVHILSGRQIECIRVHAKVLTSPFIPINNMVIAANQILQPCDLRLDLVSTENISPDWWFILQTGTALHETDNTFAFAVAPNRDLFAIKKSNTGTNSTEVHILSAASNYQHWVLQTGTVLHETDDTFNFAVASNRDLLAIKKSNTGTNSTEVHILSAASNYQSWVLQTGTVLHETDDTFNFAVASNRDLFAIKKSNTGTNSTEVHILSARKKYQQWVLQTGTALHETNNTFDFAVASNRDLFAIKKSNTGTNSTEVHILSAASNYQRWDIQTGTALHETDDTFAFAIAPNRDLVAIKKSRTGTGTTEVHILKPVFLGDLNIGQCVRGDTTSEQELLFQQRNGVSNNEVVIYFVRTLVPPSNGCAAHPSGKPGAVVARFATQWTMIHEIGHVLGLNHLDNENCNAVGYQPTRLMTGCGTGLIINPPPDLTDSEINTMIASNLTIKC